jgi:hypothetical protein
MGRRIPLAIPPSNAWRNIWPASRVARLSSVLLFRRVRDNSKPQSGALGAQGLMKFTPESRYSAMHSFGEKESRKIKELEHVPPDRREPRLWLRFFAIFPCNLVVLSYDKC